METKKFRQVNYVNLILELKVHVKYRTGLTAVKATHTGSIIGKDIEEVLEISGKVKHGIIKQLHDAFRLKPTESLTIKSMEILHNQGVTTYKI